MKRLCAQLVLVGAVVALMLWPSQPRTMATPQSVTQPDVLILAFGASDGSEQIGFTYPSMVPHAQVLRDLNALQTATRTTFRHAKISDLPPPVQGAKKKMTSVEFVTSGALSDGAHGIAVEPIIQAFRPYQHVALTYFADPTFEFQGLRNYSDKHVNITFDQRGNTFTYHIRILDAHFGRLNLPTYQPAPTDIHSVQQPAQPSLTNTPVHHAMQPWMLALVGLVALGTGIVVYVLVARNV